MQPLPLSFYRRPVLEVAPALLGKLLVRDLGERTLVGRIVEVEAYRPDDPASHAFRGLTERNRMMFEDGGRLYVYFTYGMHFCANVVTGPGGRGEAALLRAVEPLWGIEEMARRRFGKPRVELRRELLELTSGPARLCEAFGIARKENGLSLKGPEVFIASAGEELPLNVKASERVGITAGKDKPWRWYLEGNDWVTRR